MSHDVLAEACEQVLAHALDALDGHDTTPARAYLSAGDPPADCHLLAVYGVPRVKQPASTLPPRQACVILHEAEISIRYWHCAPTGVPPTVDALAAAGLLFHRTLWIVWKRLAELVTDGSLLDGVGCQNGELVDARLDDDQGGYAGWLITLRADLGPLIATAVS